VESVTTKQDAERQRADTGDRASEQGRFEAREFVARWSRETGEVLSAVVTDRMLFAYEMGYLRGRSDASQDMTKMMNERKGSDAESE
jgi:hypothetical protein